MRYLVLSFVVFVRAVVACAVQADERVEFNRDVRPILSENCFYCHGFDETNRQADLRLDTREAAVQDRGGSAAVVPGHADQSELIARIFSRDPDLRMPPAESARALTDAQRDILKRWIDQGAEYQKHWAYRELERPTVPGDAPHSGAIDAFLQRSWTEASVTPVGEASPRELIRRLSFDLRGLPPTASEVQAFEADPSEPAFQSLVQRWMDSLEYAEHQAVRWLDLVRWADSSGMVSDEPIASGAYRAYVIDAFHQNMPFDQFTIEQLAGDLLPKPNDKTLIASGYNRIVKTNSEAGVIDLEALYALKGEHVRALGTVWLGATTGCCECHDHKYDPLLAKDYYSLAAFFDDLIETGVYDPGDRRVPLHYAYELDEQRALDAELTAALSRLYDVIHRDDADLDAAQPGWEKATLAQLKDVKSRDEFVWFAANPLGARITQGDFERGEFEGRAARVVTARSNKIQRHLIAESMTGFVSEGRFKVAEDGFYVDVYLDPADPPKLLLVQMLHGAYGRLGWKPDYDETYYWGDDPQGQLQESSDWHNPETTKRMGDLPASGGWVRLRIPKPDIIKIKFYECVGMAWGQVGGTVAWGDSGMELRTDQATPIKLAETLVRKWMERPVYRHHHENRMTLASESLLKSPEERSALQSEIVRDVYREQSQPALLEKLRNVERELYTLRTQSMPVLVSRAGEPKQTRLVARGNFMDTTGPIVEPAIPEFFGKLDTGGRRANRLDLAEWLVSASNPLTPRVYVNRLWHQFYGRGLSETLEDSGGQGDWPSHPELLDWLAVEFRDSGWDHNHMVRRLVSTDAYRLSSRASAELAQRDPGNRWHARQSRHRHTAEEVRDAALAAGGLLHRTEAIPQTSFFPYQPNKYWQVSSKIMWGSRHMDWNPSADHHQYQRTLYTFWKRQNVHPTLLAFDAPTRQECTARRNLTNTPGQALALLNDPIFVEAARGLGERILAGDLPDDESRFQFAFEATLQRQAKSAEIELLTSFLNRQREHYRNNLDAARQLLSVGQKQTPADYDVSELAAWTAVARNLLNLHEFLTRS